MHISDCIQFESFSHCVKAVDDSVSKISVGSVVVDKLDNPIEIVKTSLEYSEADVAVDDSVVS